MRKSVMLLLSAVLVTGCTAGGHQIVNQGVKEASVRDNLDKTEQAQAGEVGFFENLFGVPSSEEETGIVLDEDVTIETSAGPVRAARMRTLEQPLLEAVNQYREENGHKPLHMDKRIEKAAMLRAAEIYWKWGHERPDGTRCFTAGPFYWYGENLASGYMDVESVMQGWKDSPAHNEMLLSDQVSGFYCGILFHPDGGSTWAAEFSW